MMASYLDLQKRVHLPFEKWSDIWFHIDEVGKWHEGKHDISEFITNKEYWRDLLKTLLKREYYYHWKDIVDISAMMREEYVESTNRTWIGCMLIGKRCDPVAG